MKDSNTWVGMDVHADSIRVAVFDDYSEEVRQEYAIVPDSKGMLSLLKRMKAITGKVHCVYEAGPCGYELYRYLNNHGIECVVVAPSLIPRRPGDRVKTDRRDARKLGRLHRARELTVVAVPDEKREAVRDLIRAREDLLEDVMRRRHRLVKYLLRHGHRYREGKAWTEKFWCWVGKIEWEEGPAQRVMEEYRIAFEQANEQLNRLSVDIEELAKEPEYQHRVGRLKTFRGIQTLTAMTLLAEMGSLKRYSEAPALMAAIGLVPSESSSGEKTRRGGITKTGNAHVRRVLVEAAWHYRHRPGCSARLKERRKNQPAEVVAIAQKADVRLHRKFHKLVHRGKLPCIAVVSVARELAGFLWALDQVA
jgi:transposase